MIGSLKLFLVSLLSVGFLSFAVAPTASAFDLFGNNCETVGESEVCGPCTNDNRNASVCQDSNNRGNPIYGPNGVIALAVSILSIIIGVVAVIVIIIAGIQYMLSTGDPTKVNNAKNAILYALVGLAVAAIARFVVPFILGKL